MESRIRSKPLIILIFFLALALNLGTSFALDPSQEFRSTVNDGYIKGSSVSYSAGHDATTGTVSSTVANIFIGQRYSSGIYEFWRTYLPFDTSPLPDDCTINDAVLILDMSNNYSYTEFDIVIQNGQPTYPHIPLQSGDYYYANYFGYGGQVSSATLVYGNNNITLSAAGASWISKTGTTKFCLKSSRDISSQVPSGSEYVVFGAAEAGSDDAPVLWINYTLGGNNYVLYGAYDEEGERDGAINCTLYRETEAPVTVELDGTETFNSEMIPTAFHFDIGYNESRIYYIYQVYEEIYVIKPTDPYYTYNIEIVDYVGVEWGYLETLINVNGTDRIVERWSIKVLNEMPFTLSWGTAYKLRLVCDKGSYDYKPLVAGATTTVSLPITSDMFPSVPVDTSGIATTAQRMNESWIQIYYYDSLSLTYWVNISIYEYGSTSALYSYYTTLNPVTVNWYEGGADVDYYVTISISHQTLGLKIWTLPCPRISAPESNPWTFLRQLGDFPFDAAQIPAVLILLIIFTVFSWWNAPMGIIVTVLVAFILAWLGWFAVGWAWLSMSAFFCGFIALAMRKEQEVSIG